MALSANEKEVIMAARGENNRQPTSATKLYRPLVDGKRITLLTMSDMNRDEAWAYCHGIFGERLKAID